MSTTPAVAPPAPLAWVDRLKGLALLWIFLNHLVEKIFGGPHLANPTSTWPPLTERLAQLAPIEGLGLWGAPLNALRWLGWLGDQGVGVFLLLSGFGLTLGLLKRDAPARLPLWSFYRTRLLRILPAYWLAHLPFAAMFLVTGVGLSIFAWQTWASVFGLRVTPDTLYYFSPAWWYVALTLQLYLLFPALFRVLRERGPRALVLWAICLPLLIRAVALLTTDAWLDFWSRGGLGITRLPEFASGMLLAVAFKADSARVLAYLARRRTQLVALALYALGMAASATLVGMVLAPLLLLLGLFPLALALIGVERPAREWFPLTWVGKHSYTLFLVHHPVILKLVTAGIPATAAMVFVRWGAATVATVISALALDWVTARVVAVGGRIRARLGSRRSALAMCAAMGMCLAALLVAEVAVRRLDPQEVDGWGERASLTPDEKLGWRLKPDSETHLRWLSYDYVIRANALGFPGPLVPEARSPAPSLRIMTFGDAFTSAEGVAVEQAWPRRLQTLLEAARPGVRVEVVNFAVTGYGPRQFAELAEEMLPLYRPDILLMTFFVNDFADAQTTLEDFRSEIGFGDPPQDSAGSVLRLKHLQRFLQVRVHDAWNDWRGVERTLGYGLGHLDKLRVQPPEVDAAQLDAVRPFYARVAAAAKAAGTQVIVPLIPSGPQVCGRDALAYFPRAVHLDDPKYDVERPQRLARLLTAEVAFGAPDLTPVLKALRTCPYWPGNMHFTPEGHQAVAAVLASAVHRK